MHFLSGKRRQTIRASHTSGKFCERLSGIRIGLGKGVSGWVSAYGKPMINTGPGFDFQELPEANLIAFNDVLSVPLIVEETCVGAISLYAESPLSFSQPHLDLLQKIAGLVAPLIPIGRNKKEQTGKVDILDDVSQAYKMSYLSVADLNLLLPLRRNDPPFRCSCFRLLISPRS